jgi:hypothetical protein
VHAPAVTVLYLLVTDACVSVLVLKELNYRDVFFEGPCDDGIDALCSELGWTEEFNAFVLSEVESLRRSSVSLEKSCASGSSTSESAP